MRISTKCFHYPPQSMISVHKVQAHENPITKACIPGLNMFMEMFNVTTLFKDPNDLDLQ